MTIIVSDRDMRLQNQFEEIMGVVLVGGDPMEAVTTLATALAYVAVMHGVPHLPVMSSVDHAYAAAREDLEKAK